MGRIVWGNKGWSGAFGKRLAQFVIDKKLSVLGATLAIFVVCGYGVTRIQMNDDYHVWFKANSPVVKEFESLESSYAKSDNVLFVIAPKDGNVFTRKTLDDVRWMTTEAWKLPFSTRVDSLSNFQKTDVNGDNLKVGDLVPLVDKLNDQQIAIIKEFALHEPSLVKNLVSQTGHVAAVNVMITLAGKTPSETSDLAHSARELKQKLMKRDPNVSVYITGLLMENATDAEVSMHDMSTLIPLMYIVLVISLGLMLRTVSGVFVSLATITLALLATMGITGWMGYQINVVSSIAPTIIITLAISDCVHFLVTFYQQMRRGKSKRDSVSTAITYNIYPSTMTSIANMIGFATMNFSELLPFRTFGNTVAIGSMMELLFAFLFIPALLLVLPIRVRQQTTPVGRPSRLEEGFASFVLRNRVRLIATLVFTTLLFGYFASKNHVKEDWMTWYSPRLEFRRDTDFANQNLTGMQDIQYSLGTNEPGGIYEPEFLRQVDRFAEWFRKQPGVMSVSAITDDIKRVNRTMHGNHSKWYRIPEARKLAAQYFLLYDMSLPYGMSLTTHVTRDKSATRLTARMKNLANDEILTLDRRAHDWMKVNTPLLATPKSYSSSMTLLYAQLNDRFLTGLIRTLALGFVTISILMMLLFRSVLMGIIGIIPNLIPAVLTFGVWGLVNGLVGTAVGLVCSACLGIVVDSTIHLFNHYLVGRRELGLSPEQSVFHAFERAGTAIFTTDLILMIGFGVLTLSPFAMNFVMGKMTAMIVFFDIVVTLFLTVPLLCLLENKGEGKSMLERLTEQGSVMKKIVKKAIKRSGTAAAILLVLFGLGAVRTAIAGPSDSKGLEIARRAEKKRTGYHDFGAEMRMTLKSGGSDAGLCRMKFTSLEINGDGDRELVTFSEPGDVKGTSLLTYSHKQGNDDQWLFLPALERVKRVASTNKSGSFMGSEFAYEDLTYEVLARYTYKYVRREKCEFGTCDVIEQIPTYENSGYTRTEVWYDTKEQREVRIDYFDRKNSLLKTYKTSGWKRYGRYWKPQRMEMNNVQNGNTSVLEWSDIRFSLGLAARDFDTNSLKRVR